MQGQRYTWADARADLLAGLTVAAVAVPQGMAYALIAGLPPVHGLYTAIVMTALGSLFGSSAHLINGPTNAISLVCLGAVSLLGLDSMQQRLEAVFFLSLLVGAMQTLIFFLKLGDLTRYVSESVVLGFMLGAGVLVALSQVPNLIGSPTEGHAEDSLFWRLGLTLSAHPVRADALFLGLLAGTLAVVLRKAAKSWGKAVPHTLMALVLASLAAPLVGWVDKEALEVPATLPAFHLPEFSYDRMRKLAGTAAAIALLGLLEALAIAKSIAARTRQPLDCNRQCLAEGLANIGGGCFQCMPGSGSLTRSAINFQAGAVSRLSGIWSAGFVALAVLLFADLARFVPRPALGGILVVTAWRLVDWPRLGFCLRASRDDGILAIGTAFAAVFVSIEFSILIGVLMSFLLFIPRAARLGVTELVIGEGRVLRERRQGDPPGGKVAVVGLEGEMFFGAAPELDAVLTALEGRGAAAVVLRVKRTRNPDMACLERLEAFLKDMREKGVPVLLCGVRADFAAAMERLGFAEHLPEGGIYREDEAGEGTSTLRAVARACELAGEDGPADPTRGWSYA
ncbi:MAG: SulP family inorganic anion transporter, partial [Gemmataceae bacterium]|nr:SulP family inorganic anion transporter [Gemmataceae bacterium]